MEHIRSMFSGYVSHVTQSSLSMLLREFASMDLRSLCVSVLALFAATSKYILLSQFPHANLFVVGEWCICLLVCAFGPL